MTAHAQGFPYSQRPNVFALARTSGARALETLAIFFPLVPRGEAIVRVRWGETVVPVGIKAPYRPALPPSL